MDLKFDVVQMSEVPDPPMSPRGSKYEPIYQAVKKLGTSQSKALKIPCSGSKQLHYVRAQIRELAKKDGKQLLSSRNADCTWLYLWLAGKES